MEICIDAISMGCPGNVVMAQHHTLGWASSARGVDECAALVDSNASQPCLKLCVRLLLTQGHSIFPADDTLHCGLASVLNDGAQAWEAALNLQYFVQLLLILN